MNRDTVSSWSASPARRTAGIHAGLRSHMLRICNLMAGGLALTGVVAYGAAVSGIYAAMVTTPLFWLLVFAPLALALLLGFQLHAISVGAANAAFWSYAALPGLSLAGISSIARTFLIAAATFAATSIYGYTTRTDLSRFGSFLIMGLIGVVLASYRQCFPCMIGACLRRFGDGRDRVHRAYRMGHAAHPGDVSRDDWHRRARACGHRGCADALHG